MALGVPTIVITSVTEPATIIPPVTRSKVIPIIAPCPQGIPCHNSPISNGSRCLITGQDETDFSQTPPCMLDPRIGGNTLNAVESIITSL
jgi:hypothetical protein